MTRAQSWELGGERPSVVNPRAKARAKRRARPFARWRRKGCTFDNGTDGSWFMACHVTGGRTELELAAQIVRALNAAKVTLPKPRARGRKP